MSNVDNLDCASVIHFFEEISKIPRGSGNEKQVSDYLVKFAEKRGLFVIQDKELNVIIKKSGTFGYENSLPIIIQGHMDMVCEKNKDKIHDFEKDPIELIFDGDFLKANGTTLGADNGIAVAMSLAILDSEKIEHPPIEAVFTTNEEVGMDGAQALESSLFQGKTLINIDSEDEGIFTTGCAGGMRTTSFFPIENEIVPDNYSSYLFIVGGLRGGHSGIDITAGRANSNVLLFRVLNDLRKDFDIKISSLNGGAKDNAIPREAEAIISFDKNKLSEIEQCIFQQQEVFRNEYRNTDTNILLKIEENDKYNKCLSEQYLKRIISAGLLFPNGVQTMSTDIEGLPESSNNLGVIETNEKDVIFTCALRSSVVSRKYYMLEQIKLITELSGGNITSRGDYPAWEYNPDSHIRKVFIDVYKEMYGEEPVINTIHAGLECGLFAKIIKNADMISFGPNIYDVHTPDEKISISSVERTWKYFLNVLTKLK